MHSWDEQLFLPGAKSRLKTKKCSSLKTINAKAGYNKNILYSAVLLYLGKNTFKLISHAVVEKKNVLL